jgi:molybdate transport system substrate-binding protein
VCLLVALATWLLPGVPGRAVAGEVLVSAAASLTGAFTTAARDFEGAHPGTRIALNFGASGALAAQIAAGAPVAVFASASPADMDRLEAAGRLVAGTRTLFASNRLLVVVPAGAVAAPDSLAGLADPATRRIAVGNPKTSPAGRYAEQALRSAGVLEAVRGRLVLAETVRQILDWVARGEVDAGLLYATDAAARPGEVRVAAAVPAAMHDPILYPAAVVAGAPDPVAAGAFVGFLASADGRAVLARFGFAPPP